jgi:hypothetical protein
MEARAAGIPCLVLVAVLAIAACSRADAPVATPAACDPFANLQLDRASADDRKALAEAAEDFCTVVSGRRPVHAKLDANFAKPPNGGTTRYLGRGYVLTSVLDTRYVGGDSVGLAGPILRLEPPLAPEPVEISQVRIVKLPPQH